MKPLEWSHAAAWSLGGFCAVVIMEFGWAWGVGALVVSTLLRVLIEGKSIRAHNRQVKRSHMDHLAEIARDRRWRK